MGAREIVLKCFLCAQELCLNKGLGEHLFCGIHLGSLGGMC
jgi:hypothetical protein